MQIRQGAIDALLSTIEETDFENNSDVQVPQLLEFLFQLMDDPNFKIKQGGIQTISLLIQKIGKDIEFYLR